MLSSRSRSSQSSSGVLEYSESLPFRNRTGSVGPSNVSSKVGGTSVAVGNVNAGERLLQRIWWLCAICFVMMLYGGVFRWDPADLEEHKRAVSPKDHVTVMINTYKRPPEVIEDAIEYYKQCNVVKYVYVVWSDLENPPPKSMLERYARQNAEKHNNEHVKKVGFRIQQTTSLNNRFRPLDDVEHTDGIFAVDDDMRVTCRDLALAFEVWQKSPQTLVGFMPRVHLRDSQGIMRYRCWWSTWWHGVYSIILTKAAILHHNFLTMYTNDMPVSIRDLVDHERNCEDIAMQFMMSNHTGLSPIYVKGHLRDLGVFSGLSTSHSVAKAKHMDARSKCLNELTNIYGGANPLVTSHHIVDSASNGWVYTPSTVFEYISSDLWAGFFD
jgi:hypothetical protein